MMEVRHAGAEDATAIAEVQIASRRKAYAHFFDPSFLAGLDVAEAARFWQERIAEATAGDSAVFVAIAETRVAGYAQTVRLSAADGEVRQLYVHPDCWRSGAGSALLTACEQRLVERGIQHAVLWVYEENRNARGFYEHQGWNADGESRFVERGTSVLQLRYHKPLATPAC